MLYMGWPCEVSAFWWETVTQVANFYVLVLENFATVIRCCIGAVSKSHQWSACGLHLWWSNSSWLNAQVYYTLVDCNSVPSVLWRFWLGSRKGIQPVKNRVVGCWHGYLSGTRCRLAHGPADATATHCLLLSKIQIGFTFLVPAHLGSPGKRAAVKRAHACACVCVCVHTLLCRSWQDFDWHIASHSPSALAELLVT